MKNNGDSDVTTALRLLPSIEELLDSEIGRQIAADIGHERSAELARSVTEVLRQEIRSDPRTFIASLPELSKGRVRARLSDTFGREWKRLAGSRLRRVINATGVVIHTNLGRAPLSEAAVAAIAEAGGYCTLEYDVETGKRGRRGASVETLAAELVGAEDAIVVNNCAAAALLVLAATAAGREVIVSRGELVEIGGDFRIPDVLTQSGAVLREVGTTNRTKPADYEKAISERTGLLLKVHPSNYRVIGFTESPPLKTLAEIAARHKLLLYEDAGSGALTDLAPAGITGEPQIAGSITDGADVVTFSGDKLLGGPQCGIIVGRASVIAAVRKHPLYRALRADKLAYAALAATLGLYARGTSARDVPVQRMLFATKEELSVRAHAFADRLREGLGSSDLIEIAVVDGDSAVGGGAAPEVRMETCLVALSRKGSSPQELESILRASDPPAIARITDDKLVLDLRTVPGSEEAELLSAVLKLGKA